MLDNIKRWFSRDAAALPWADVEAWARSAGHRFARAKEGEGFVVDGVTAADAPLQRSWRLEWGPPQRAYISGHELRLRMEIGLPLQLQMLVMSRGLMETLESELFERSTQDLQTHIDMSVPEEMRWLSMFAKSPVSARRELRAHFSGVANDPALLAAWVDDDLAQRLTEATRGVLLKGPPFVLMSMRGKLYLRLQLAEPVQAAVTQAVEVFEAAVLSALQVAVMVRADAAGWPSTAATAWQNQFPHEPR